MNLGEIDSEFDENIMSADQSNMDENFVLSSSNTSNVGDSYDNQSVSSDELDIVYFIPVGGYESW